MSKGMRYDKLRYAHHDRAIRTPARRSPWRTIKARLPHVCDDPLCGHEIKLGTLILWHEAERVVRCPKCGKHLK